MSDGPGFTVTRFYRCSMTTAHVVTTRTGPRVSEGICSGHFSAHVFLTAQEARDFRVRALQMQGKWAPSGATEVEVSEISGPGIIHDRPNPAAFQRGMAQLRETIAAIPKDSPLLGGIGKTVHVPTAPATPYTEQAEYTQEPMI